jgi:hypothetical protein
MKRIGFILLGLMITGSIFGLYIPKKDKSDTTKVSLRLDKVSNAEDKGQYYDRFIQVTCIGDNRNTEEITVSVGFYLIGRNSTGLYKLLKSETTSSTMKKFTKKNDLGKVRYNYKDYKGGSTSGRNGRNNKAQNKKTHFEYRGCLVVIKGPDGKIITIEGEYGKLYTFIEAKGEDDIFNSKGEEKDPSYER